MVFFHPIYEKVFAFLVFIYKLKYIPNFIKPRSFNEKLNFIKLNRTQFKLRCYISDRLSVRDYVKKNSPDCVLIDVLWHGACLDEKVWGNMPQKFVIKANHGSGMVLIVDKEKHSYSQVFEISEKWKNTDYAKRGGEWFYKDLDRTLIIEEFVQFENDVPPDYKFFCFHGKVKLVQVDLDRYSCHVRNLYDENFSFLEESLYYPRGYEIAQPFQFEKAKKIAEQLSAEFDFIRVDLYLLENKVLFGELTNLPGNGFESFNPKYFDFQVGQWLQV